MQESEGDNNAQIISRKEEPENEARMPDDIPEAHPRSVFNPANIDIPRVNYWPEVIGMERRTFDTVREINHLGNALVSGIYQGRPIQLHDRDGSLPFEIVIHNEGGPPVGILTIGVISRLLNPFADAARHSSAINFPDGIRNALNALALPWEETIVHPVHRLEHEESVEGDEQEIDFANRYHYPETFPVINDAQDFGNEVGTPAGDHAIGDPFDPLAAPTPLEIKLRVDSSFTHESSDVDGTLKKIMRIFDKQTPLDTTDILIRHPTGHPPVHRFPIHCELESRDGDGNPFITAGRRFLSISTLDRDVINEISKRWAYLTGLLISMELSSPDLSFYGDHDDYLENDKFEEDAVDYPQEPQERLEEGAKLEEEYGDDDGEDVYEDDDEDDNEDDEDEGEENEEEEDDEEPMFLVKRRNDLNDLE